MSVKILYRPAEVVEGEWQTLATVRSAHAAADELASWRWDDPSHGDLVRLVGAKGEHLFVFDSAKSGFVEVKAKRGQPAWVDRWEGVDASAEKMLRECDAVDRRRLVLAACACAETVLRFVPTSEDRPRIAIETARAWAHGEASIEDAKKARDAAYAVAKVSAVVSAYAVAKVSAVVSAYAAAATACAAAACAAAADAADAAADAVADAAADAYSYNRRKYLRSMVPLVRRYIPLSALACALVGARDPLPLPRSNPSHRRGSRAR